MSENLDRKWIREKLAQANLPSVEITAYHNGKPSKETFSYEIARVCEYVINGSLVTGNRQALQFFHSLLQNMIVSFGLIPNEKTAQKIDQWISEELPKLKAKFNPDFTVINVENITSGRGPIEKHVVEIEKL